MERELESELRRGFREAIAVEQPAVDLDPTQVKAQLRDHSLPYAERDRLMAVVVRRYRLGPKQQWGPVLLELLAPLMLARLGRLQAEPPVFDDEDLIQQLIVEVLAAAATMPLPPGARHLERRLMKRANWRLSRRLRRERRWQQDQIPLLEPDDDGS